MKHYGSFQSYPPEAIEWVEFPAFTEMMFYQYLPVAMRECDTGVPFAEGIRLEPRLEQFRELLLLCWDDARTRLPNFNPKTYYCYLTAKRGWASTENPLNRPGWHVDAYGIPEDMTYVWTDSFPTRYITGPVVGNLEDDRTALEAFERAGRVAEDAGKVQYVEPYVCYAFDQEVVHATPVIEEPGMRSFLKINVSPHEYNLVGNSHNYELVYDWTMHDRAAVRNHPEQNNGDFVV